MPDNPLGRILNQNICFGSLGPTQLVDTFLDKCLCFFALYVLLKWCSERQIENRALGLAARLGFPTHGSRKAVKHCQGVKSLHHLRFKCHSELQVFGKRKWHKSPDANRFAG